MGLYITGDCHGEFNRFANQKNAVKFAKNDIIIIAGDMGLPWGHNYFDNNTGDLVTTITKQDLWWMQWLGEKPCIFLYCDGNHENFDLLEDDSRFPVKTLFNGTVSQISKNIYRAHRGEVYNINGYTCFMMGGATSIDKAFRKPHISWWSQEIPSTYEWEHAFNKLEENLWKVDFVVTHTAPNKFLTSRPGFDFYGDMCPVRQMLDRIEDSLSYREWFFGHFHEDYDDSINFCRWLYKDIVRIS